MHRQTLLAQFVDNSGRPSGLHLTYTGCMQVTEQAVQSNVTCYMSEPLLANLCTMFEVLDANGQDGLDAKRKLQSLLGPVVPDDFDLSIMQAAPA